MPKMHVDPWVLLRMIIAKQARSERLMLTARRFAVLTPQKRERVLLYEAMQADIQGEVSCLRSEYNTCPRSRRELQPAKAR